MKLINLKGANGLRLIPLISVFTLLCLSGCGTSFVGGWVKHGCMKSFGGSFHAQMS